MPTPDTKVRAGVVGVGAIGQNHARVYASLENARLAAIYDTDPARAADFAARYGTVATTDLEEFASLVDAASVSTPTVTHRAIAELLLDRGVHCLVEKPIAASPEDAAALVAKAKEKDRLLQVGHIETLQPDPPRSGDAPDRPTLHRSPPALPFPERSTDVGVVLDVMIHDLEIVLHLVKSPITHIDAVGVPVLTKREDIANARIRFASGCVANITASRVSPEKLRKIRVFQGDTYLSLDYQAQSGKIFRRDGLQIVPEDVLVERDEPLKLELESFIHCVATGQRPRVSGAEAAAALDLAIEITRLIGETPA